MALEFEADHPTIAGTSDQLTSSRHPVVLSGRGSCRTCRVSRVTAAGVRAKGRWSSGVWTLEFSRRLDTGHPITSDEELLRAADLLPHEKVDIYDLTNGAPLSTYVIRGEAGSGVIGINGAAAHLVKPGDRVIIASYAQLATEEARSHRPRICFVDSENRLR